MATIIGGTGNDKKTGTQVPDQIDGLAGNDSLLGQAGDDTLNGGEGDDTLNGGTGADSMTGSLGNDVYVVDNADDMVIEESDGGTDTVQSCISWTLGEHVENLTLTGTSAINGTGNDGDNILTGNAKANVLTGGEGNDTYFVQSATDTVVELENEGTDTIRTTASYTLSDNVEMLVLLERTKAQIKAAKLINATGNAGDNYLTGNSENNTLDGGQGTDIMSGGKGNDTYIVDNDSDIVSEGAGRGTDTVKASVDYTLAANVENLILLGEDDLDGTGNDLKNALTGNDGDNLLDGDEGADTMKGLGGNDTYMVDNAKDSVIEEANKGTDSVVSSLLNYTLAGNVENLSLQAGSDNLNGTGNTANNTIEGNDGNNRLDGGKGADTLIGYEGDDTYVLDNIGDVVIEQDGDGEDTIVVGRSYTLGDFLENLTLTGTGNYLATGNALENTLRGNDGKNTLDGGDGADVMDGGKGDDLYFVNDAGDVVRETSSKGGTDTVRASLGYTLGNNIENLVLLSESVGLFGMGNALANKLTGTGNNDTLNGATGNDTLNGGSGTDRYAFSSGFGKDVISDVGTDGVLDLSAVTTNGTVNLKVDSKKAEATYGSNTINWNANAILNVEGGSGNDKITGDIRDNDIQGNDGNDTLNGGSGNDTMDGGAGNDLLVGGAGEDVLSGDGTDTLTGGADNDAYYITGVGVVINEEVNGGDDSVYTTVSYTLGNNLDDLFLDEDAGNINGTGNGLANYIGGNNGNNSLNGGAGNDTLNGGQGADTLLGGLGDDDIYVDADDTVIEDSQGGTDTIFAAFSYTLGNNLENLTLLGGGSLNGTGNSLNNYLTGGDGINVLNGGGGNDTLNGGNGNDTYVISADATGGRIIDSDGTDTLDMRLLTGDLTVNLATGSLSLSNEITIEIGSNSLEYIDSGAGNDWIMAGTGDSYLEGNDGADTLQGNAGDDYLLGGAAYDTYVFSPVGAGTDTIDDFGSDVLDDSAGSGLVDLSYFNSSDVASWAALDGADGDSFVDRLEITFTSGASITINNYFDNTGLNGDASDAGTGFLDIAFSDGQEITFSQVQDLIRLG